MQLGYTAGARQSELRGYQQQGCAGEPHWARPEALNVRFRPKAVIYKQRDTHRLTGPAPERTLI